MSDIVKARRLLKDATKLRKLADELTEQALSLMRREPPVRKARKRYVRITEEKRSEVQRLALDKSLTTHDIASLTGLRSSGRVSEVLRGKR
jgi:hypothetical protein